MDDARDDFERPDPPAVLSFGGAMRAEAGTPSAPGRETQLDRRLSEIETRMEKLAERFDQLEFVIVEQFEPGMTATGSIPPGNLRERLDRIEAVLGLLSQSGEERPTPEPSPSGPRQDRDALAAGLSETAVAHAERLDGVETRLEGLAASVESFAEEARGRHRALLDALETVSRRPMPAPDLTAQHRSFAGFATALQVTLDRLDGAVAEILTGFASMSARLETLQAQAPAEDVPVAGAPEVGGDLGAGFGALCDRIGALTEVIADAAERGGSAELTALSDRIDALAAILSAGLGEAAAGQQAAIGEALRDLRLAVAEVAAENRRLWIARAG